MNKHVYKMSKSYSMKMKRFKKELNITNIYLLKYLR